MSEPDPSRFFSQVVRNRETEICRDRLGKWFMEGDPITHPNLVHALEGWVGRAEDGRPCLRNDLGWAYFHLEGPDYFVRHVKKTPVGQSASGVAVAPLLDLSGGREEVLNPGTLSMNADGHLVCTLVDGLSAWFSSQAQFELGAFLVDDEPVTFRFSNEHFVVSIAQPEASGV